MKTETTAPFATQASAIQMLTELIVQFGDLPSAYIAVHTWQGKSTIDLLLNTPDDFEKWRTALGVDAAGVDLHVAGRGSWVEVETVRDGIKINLSAHGIMLTVDQLDAPRIREDVAA